MTYVGIFEDCDITVGVFIVKGNARLPLHNHPMMHGILKIVHGTLNLSCYNKIPPPDMNQHHIPDALKRRIDLIERGYVVPTQPMLSNVSMSSTSYPLILSPEKDNYHEICNYSNQPAAFLDILSPPYNHGEELDLDGAGDLEKRECQYFKEIHFQLETETEKKIAWLQMIQTPSDFHCDTEPYRGPTIDP